MAETRYGLRRSHTKSRKGCDDCKKRKVKCDERYPSCFNCTRRGIGCSFALKNPPGENTPLTTQSRSPPGATESLTGRFSSWRQLDPSHEQWWLGMELMHHYTNMTANTLALRPDMQHTWRVIIPELAYDSQLLMHGLLSVAALHKAYLLPSQREKYLDVAAHHQCAGLEGFRLALSNINNDNWKICMCFASLIAASAYAGPVLTMTTSGWTTPKTLEVFGFIRGIRTVLAPYQSKLTSTTLSPLVSGVWIVNEVDPSYRNPSMDRTAVPPGFAAALNRLRDYYGSNVRGRRQIDYMTAVQVLEKSYYQVAHAGFQPEVGMLLFTLYALPEQIMGEIETLHPFALVYLAYFSVLSQVLEPRFWFIQGWARNIFAIVIKHLPNEAVYMEIMDWPRQYYIDLL